MVVFLVMSITTLLPERENGVEKNVRSFFLLCQEFHFSRDMSPSPFAFEKTSSLTLLQSRKLLRILLTGVCQVVSSPPIYTGKESCPCPTSKNSVSAQSKYLRYCKPAMTRAAKNAL